MSPADTSIIGRIIAAVSPPTNNGFVGRAVVLPQTLQAQNKAQIIAGEVIEELGKDVLRIRTPAGDIDVRVTGRNRPTIGQQVRVEIPAGNPPRQITVTPAPEQPNQTQNTQNAQNTSTSPNQTAAQTNAPASTTQPNTPTQTTQQATQPAPSTGQTTSTSATQTPAQINAAVRETLSQILRQPGQIPVTVPDTKTLPALERGNIVRLLPLTPLQTQQTLQSAPLPQNIETVLPQNIAARAQASALQTTQIVQNTQSTEIINQLLTPQSANIPPAQTPQTIQTPQVQNISLPTFNQTTGANIQFITTATGQAQILTPNAPAQNVQTAPSVIQTSLPSITPAQNIYVSNVNAAVSQLVVNTPQASQNASAQSGTTAQAITSLDIRIQNFTPTSIQVTAPQNTGQISPNAQINAVINQIQTPNFQLLQGQATTIPAQVIGFTNTQLPIVVFQPPAASLPQNFILQAPAPNLSVGSQIQILPQSTSILTQPAQITPQTPLQPPTLFDLLRPGPWPALEQLYQASIQVSAQAASALTNIVPNPTVNVQNMGPAALFFLAAVRSGDLSSWLGGKTLDALNRIGKGSSLTSVSNDLAALPRGEAPIGEWRAVPLPLFYEGEMQKMTLYTRSDHDGSSDDDENKQTRFLFDLDLSRMGPVQLDGLIKGQRLDLIVRTQTPFSEPMRQVMRQSYTKALDSTELYGELNFQGDPKHWVNVLQKEETFGADI